MADSAGAYGVSREAPDKSVKHCQSFGLAKQD